MSMIKIENLTFSYPTSYDNIFEDVNIQIDTDWKLGFVGRNGRGKTTLLNLLLGKYEYSGKIHTTVQFDYFPYSVADKSEFVERFPELSLFYRLFSPLYSEMICIFPYFCPYTESARE